jgi:hypothetical protein
MVTNGKIANCWNANGKITNCRWVKLPIVEMSAQYKVRNANGTIANGRILAMVEMPMLKWRNCQ